MEYSGDGVGLTDVRTDRAVSVVGDAVVSVRYLGLPRVWLGDGGVINAKTGGLARNLGSEEWVCGVAKGKYVPRININGPGKWKRDRALVVSAVVWTSRELVGMVL